MKKIKLLKGLMVQRDQENPELVQLRVTGITGLKQLISPVIASVENHDNPPGDGIYEFDLLLSDTGMELTDVDLEVSVIFQLKDLPGWVKAIRVNAEVNSEIEIIN
ncbi:MAG: hypothetical protein ACNA7V_03375 [Bacteroidales bacterium]